MGIKIRDDEFREKGQEVVPEGPIYWKNRPDDDERKDWYDDAPWVKGYWNSQDHPHRELILDVLKNIEPFSSLLEIGSNCGPNLVRIQARYPAVLYGMDINKSAIEFGKAMLPGVTFVEADLISTGELESELSNSDVILADAVLMYIDSDNIYRLLSKMVNAAQKGIIIVDFYDEGSDEGIVKYGHWARNYEHLLKDLGMLVEKTKITKETWPNLSGNWADIGYMIIGRCK